MGIDYQVVSLTNPYMFSNAEDSYLKWAWRSIDWKAVLDFLQIDLSCVGGTAINYWAESQVEDMRDLIRDLSLTPDYEFKDDAAKLLAHFNYYVEQKARIYVF